MIDTPAYSGPLYVNRDNNSLTVRLESSRYMEINWLSGRARPYLLSQRFGEIPSDFTSEDQNVLQSLQAHSGGLAGLATYCEDHRVDPLAHLTLPLSAEEKTACRDLVRKVQEVRDCSQHHNCPQVYQKYYHQGNLRHPASFSFIQYFQTGDGRIKAIATASAVAWGSEVSLWTLGASSRALVPYVGRGAIAVGIGASAVVSWLSVPVTLLWLYLTGESCDPGLNDPSNQTLPGCFDRSPRQLENIFGREIQQALNHPDEFLRSLENSSNPMATRLACGVVEEMSTSQDQSFQSLSCQGRTLSIAHDNYLIDPSGTLYRHENMELTYRFGGPERVQAEARGSIPIPPVLPSRVQAEARLIETLSPRINEVYQTCSVPQEGPLQYRSAPSTN